MASYEYKGVVVELKDPKEMAFTIAKQILEIAHLKSMLAGSETPSEPAPVVEQPAEEVSLPKQSAHAPEEDVKDTVWAQH